MTVQDSVHITVWEPFSWYQECTVPTVFQSFISKIAGFNLSNSTFVSIYFVSLSLATDNTVTIVLGVLVGLLILLFIVIVVLIVLFLIFFYLKRNDRKK